MAILKYTTQINFHKTIGEITQCLVNHGAFKIVSDYKDGIPISITFCLKMNENIIGFSLPANYEGVLKSMENNKKVAKNLCNKEQAIRVSWRIIKTWVEGQMAIVEAQLADMAEVFLPYAITDTGDTLYNKIKSGNEDILMLGG